MKRHELPLFCDLFEDLLTFLPHNRALTSEGISKLAEGYFEELSELNLETVTVLFRLARRECEWFPTIAWLRHKAGLEDQPTPRERLEGRAEDVWRRLTQPEHDPLTGKWRAYCREVVQGDPIAAQLVREMGAGYDFNRWEVEDRPHRKREFLESYIALTLAQDRRAKLGEGLSHDDSAAFLRASGLGDILGFGAGRNGQAR